MILVNEAPTERKANVVFKRMQSGEVELHTARQIRAGEELVAWYGDLPKPEVESDSEYDNDEGNPPPACRKRQRPYQHAFVFGLQLGE